VVAQWIGGFAPLFADLISPSISTKIKALGEPHILSLSLTIPYMKNEKPPNAFGQSCTISKDLREIPQFQTREVISDTVDLTCL
jgi:hypothetical protein